MTAVKIAGAATLPVMLARAIVLLLLGATSFAEAAESQPDDRSAALSQARRTSPGRG